MQGSIVLIVLSLFSALWVSKTLYGMFEGASATERKSRLDAMRKMGETASYPMIGTQRPTQADPTIENDLHEPTSLPARRDSPRTPHDVGIQQIDFAQSEANVLISMRCPSGPLTRGCARNLGLC